MAPGVWVETLSSELLAHMSNKNPSHHLPVYPFVQNPFANCFFCFSIHSFASCTSFVPPLIYCFFHSFIHMLIPCSFVKHLDLFILLPLMTLPCLPSSIVHLEAQSLAQSASDFFIPSLFLSLVHSFSHPWMYSFIHHFVHLFLTFWFTRLFSSSCHCQFIQSFIIQQGTTRSYTVCRVCPSGVTAAMPPLCCFLSISVKTALGLIFF